MARWVAPRRPDGALQLSLAKGYELGTLKRPTEVIAEETGAGAAALSGPNHAEEVSTDMPSATVIAAADEALALALQAAVTSDTFRVYTNDDVVGVEFCGAVKNPIAVAVGMSDGLGLRRQLPRQPHHAQPRRDDAARHASRARTSPPSPASPASATSSPPAPRGTAATAAPASCWPGAPRRPRSSSRSARSSRASPPPTRSTTCAARLGVEMPVTENVYQVLEGNRTPQECVADLMGRTPKKERHE